MTKICKDITVQWLANELRKAQREINWADVRDTDEPWVDVRLQATEHDGWLRVGQACYDTDHSGYWGSSEIHEDDDYSALLSVAEDMIAQAEEMAAEDTE